MATAGTISAITWKSSILLTATFVAKSGASAAGSWPLTVTNPDGGTGSSNLTVAAPWAPPCNL